MAATTDINHESTRARWPRDLRIFVWLALVWAAALVARIVVRDLTYYSPPPLEAIFLGMRFDGYHARLVVIAQAMTVATAAIGVNHGRRWGLALAIIYLFEMVASNLIFMMTYMNDLSEARNVRLSGLVGIASVLILLYLWIRARDLLFE